MRARIWLLALLFALAACGHAGASVVAPSSPPVQHDSGLPCDQTGTTAALSKDFAPVLAKRCLLVEPTPTDYTHWTREEQVAHGRFDALLRALRLPSEPRQPLPCPSPVQLGVTLVDAGGTAITPAPPEDFCGRPLSAIWAATDAMPWQTVSRTTVPRS